MHFLKNIPSAIKRFFSNLGSGSSTSSVSNSTNGVAPQNGKPFSMVNPNTKVIVALGHSYSGADKGAWGNGTNEVDYNSWVMKKVHNNLPEVGVVFGSSSLNAVNVANGFKPVLIIQAHCNAFNGSAHGCETPVRDGDTRSYPYAEKFVHDYTKRFNRTMRRPYALGKFLVSTGGRGIASLNAANCATFIAEPFFIDNPRDFVPKEEYAEFLTQYCKEVLESWG